MFHWKTEGPDQTEALGKAIGDVLEDGDLFLLQGTLGVGKTTFVKGVALGLGVSGVVKSPTFALHLSHDGRLLLHHIDLYRLETTREVMELGLDEVFGMNGVCFVEWPERLEVSPDYAVWVRITEGPAPDRRTFSFQGPLDLMGRLHGAVTAAGFREAPTS